MDEEFVTAAVDFLHDAEVRRINTMKRWTCELAKSLTLEEKNKARRD